ncbi:MAG TPA: ribosome assembly RNA-binding protein YhbY [Burkholderiales bacterium]|jgi:putative YhbY family RNA-binding protein|nr:ribosome assembly RNA-binding protein YhbY [Burkholderiales bacterium]
MHELSPARRRELKARAHALDPVVLIGGAGLSPAVLAEIDRGLKNHELIKVRVPGADRPGREVILEEICTRTGAQPVQHIGKVLVLFREKPGPSPDSAEESLRRKRRGR